MIAKMDATANDVPSQYDVRGFPTIYFVPKGSKDTPKRYEVPRLSEALALLTAYNNGSLKAYNSVSHSLRNVQ